MVGENFSIKLRDIWFARYVQQDFFEEHSEAVFNVKWTSSEALAHERFSSKSDVWSFGVVLWDIFSYGMCPYSDVDVPHISVYRHIQKGGRMACPEGCLDAVFSLMQKCWQ